MKKALLFSLLSVFCLSFAACTMNKKDDKKKHSHPHHRRYHSEACSER
ncbi:MAG: hypothetical protein S4CHLAM20_13760 [Chlamydiia bacterium]|nr:hypothetical protein [Chlamydiia bacterium]